MSMYSRLKTLFKTQGALTHIQRQRQIGWRRELAIQRIERPTNLVQARSVGWKAKQGYSLVRVRISRGGKRRPTIAKGRRSRNYGQKFVQGKNYRWISEERAAKKYKNLEVLNSYNVGKDGLHYWHEIIMLDPNHPVIKKDPKTKNFKKTGRVHRGKTSAGKRSRGLQGKGKGREKIRPSLRSHKRLGK